MIKNALLTPATPGTKRDKWQMALAIGHLVVDLALWILFVPAVLFIVGFISRLLWSAFRAGWALL